MLPRCKQVLFKGDGSCQTAARVEEGGNRESESSVPPRNVVAVPATAQGAGNTGGARDEGKRHTE